MAKEAWVFQPTPKMGGATGEAYTNPLHGTGMDPAAVLAREAIQNSSDAQASSEKVRVVFRRVSLTGTAKQDFIKAMQFSPAMTARKAKLKLPRGACLSTLAEKEQALELLYIEDYGTFGLHGDPLSSKSHFFRLLLSLGDGSKARESAGSGGSYGFGKSVYSSNSRIHTVVAYSVIDPKLSGRKPGDHSRLMGCAYFNSHEHEGRDFSGRAWFGIPDKDGQGAEPLVDKDAQALAEKLGFEKRSPSNLGTSLLIVDCGVDTDQLRESIEDWWWPRLVDGETGIDVVMYQDGKLVAPPRPKKRPDLRPFIECFDLACGKSAPTGEHQKVGSLYRLNDWNLGNFGFVVLPDSDVNGDERLNERVGTIALIRGPRMVIEYMSVGSGLPLPCVGAFVAHADVDDALKRSEPASHDKWDPKSARLEEMKDEAREAVVAVLKRLKVGLRRFANDAAPKTSDQESRLRSLEKLLGGVFRPPTEDSRPPIPPSGDPIRVTFSQQPHPIPTTSGIATKGAFKVAIAEEADKERVKLRLKVRCYVQEDEALSLEDPVPVHIEPSDLEGPFSRLPDGSLEFELGRDEHPTFKFKSDSYARDWSTGIKVSIEEVA